jgi:hypothetical protein
MSLTSGDTLKGGNFLELTIKFRMYRSVNAQYAFEEAKGERRAGQVYADFAR